MKLKFVDKKVPIKIFKTGVKSQFPETERMSAKSDLKKVERSPVKGVIAESDPVKVDTGSGPGKTFKFTGAKPMTSPEQEAKNKTSIATYKAEKMAELQKKGKLTDKAKAFLSVMGK